MAGAIPSDAQVPAWIAFVDRWIYVFMAAFLIAITLTGFVPDSFKKIAGVESGMRPPLHWLMHLHAVVMGAWLLLLLAQTSLMATGNVRYHKALGIAAFVLAPVILATGLMLVPVNYTQIAAFAAQSPPDLAAALHKELIIKADFLLLQLRSATLFAVLVTLGICARQRDAGFHKRLMVIATLIPLPAAIARISWLPSTVPQSLLSLNIAILVCVLPMFLWDMYRLKRVHAAYIVAFALWLPFVVAGWLLWGTDGWRTFAAGLLNLS